jgi:riboflavin synthase
VVGTAVFTGLIAGVGQVLSAEQSDDGVVLAVRSTLAGELAEGDSVAVNGVCLTAVSLAPETFSAEVMNETLGGHVVQGHVDGVGTVASIEDDGFARRVTVQAPDDVLRYVVEKGSIAVDGVSLTVAGIDGRSFTVSLIPETLQRTTLGELRIGMTVNLEVDVLAKYVEKLMTTSHPPAPR